MLIKYNNLFQIGDNVKIEIPEGSYELEDIEKFILTETEELNLGKVTTKQSNMFMYNVVPPNQQQQQHQ